MHRVDRRRWWLVFGLLTACFWAWASTMPLFSAPDEPAHVVRAVSLSEGTILPDTADRQTPAQWGAFGAWAFAHASEVRIAEIYRSASSVGCYAFKRDVPADCAFFAGQSQAVKVLTTAGRHPPAYYAVLGAATRILPDRTPKIYVMRFLAAALAAGLIASALSSVRRCRNPRLASLGPLLAATPMMFFLGGSVNPSSLEIAGAIGLWCGVVAIWAGIDEVDSRHIARCAIAAVTLVLARPLGPLWLLLIALTAVALLGPRRSIALLRNRTTALWSGLVGIAVVAQTAWVLGANSLDASRSNTTGYDAPLHEVLRVSFGTTWDRARDMIGRFGWLDTPVPSATVLMWMITVGMLFGIALTSGRRKPLALAGLCLVAVIVVPLIAEAPRVHDAGFFWQGRYTMPLAVGIPILLATSTSSKREHEGLRLGPFLGISGTALIVGQLLALAQAQRRFMVGYSGKLLYWFDPSWSPPVPALLAFFTFTGAYITLVWVLLRQSHD